MSAPSADNRPTHCSPTGTPDQATPLAPATPNLAGLSTGPHGAAPAAGAARLPEGYEYLGVLGRGGMGVVYHARQVAANRPVALKMVLGGEQAAMPEQTRLRGEAQAVAGLQHPNVVAVYEVGEFEGRPFFSMEFCPGGTLAARRGGNPMPPPAASELVEKLARAVAAAHAAGVIHRDLKPSNVLLAADGTPKVSDFGLAKRVEADSGLTATGAVLGTPSYMPPEQAFGETKRVGPRADVYSLGAVFYELLTGRPPFKGVTMADTLHQVRTQEPVAPRSLNGAVPRDLDNICLKCLEKDPARRYASAAELADDLARWRAGEPVRARPVGQVERAWRLCRRHSGTAIAGAAAVLILLRYDLLEPLLADVLERSKRTLGETHPERLIWLVNLGSVIRKRGRPAEAEAVMAGAVALFAKAHGDRHPRTLEVTSILADVKAELGKRLEAAVLLRTVAEGQREALGADDPQRAGTLASLGMVLLTEKQYDEAEPILRECLAIREKKLPDDWRRFYAMSLLGQCLLGQQKPADAGPLLRGGYEGLRDRQAKVPPSVRADRLRDAATLLVQRAEAVGDAGDAARWRAEAARYPGSPARPR